MIKRNVLLGCRTFECFHSSQCLKRVFAPVKRKVHFPKFCLTFGRDSLILCLAEQLKKFENLVKYNEKQLGLMSEDREKRV